MLLTVAAAVAVGTGTYYLYQKMRNNEEAMDTLHYAGIPDQVGTNEIDDIENAKMVSEGSQFGVQYYNDVKEGNYQ